MASETEDLVEQLKEIVESLKSVSQYSKDLTSAVSSANRPMQQMSDYAKAVGEQMKTVAKSMDEMNKSLEGVSTDMSDLLTKTATASQAESDSLRILHEKQATLTEEKTKREEMLQLHTAIKIKQDEFWMQETTKGKERNEAMESMGSLWDKAKKKAQEYQMEMAKSSKMKETMAATAAQGLTGSSSLQGAMGQMSGALGSLLPTAGGIGGLIGMILYGKMREAEFNAVGEAVGQQFDAIGGHTSRFAGRMGSLSKDLSAYGMLAKDDLLKVAGAMSELGMSQKDAETKISGFQNQAGSDFMAFSISMDKAFEMASGTTARLAGTLKRDFGASTKEAAENLKLMAQGAKDTGQNVTVFMQQVMDASSALRLMHANQSAVIALQAGAAKAFGKTLGAGHEAEAGAYAAQGTSQVAGAIGGGMEKGVMAVLAQRMFGGDAGDALAKYRSMAARGGESFDTKKAMTEMVNMMKEAGATTEFQKQEFGKGVFGLDAAGVDALTRGVEEMKNGGEVSSKTMEEINKSLGMEAKKTSVMERLVNEIKNAVADVMVGLLGMIVNGLKLLYNGVMAGFYTLKDALTIGGDKEAAGMAKAYMKNVGLATTGMGAAADKMKGGIGQLPGIAQQALGAFGLSGGWTVDSSHLPKTDDEESAAARAQLAHDSAKNKANTAAMLKAYSAIMHDKTMTKEQKQAWQQAHPVGSDFTNTDVHSDAPGGSATKRPSTIKVVHTEGREQKGKGEYGPPRRK